MGFYGNIVNSNKASFTFDRIYSSRRAMDAAMSVNEGDGVFLGRYVLIDYDEPPIKGYYFANDKKFYHDVHHTRMIAGKEGCIYQDLHTGSVNNFYLYENGVWKLNNTGTPYAASYTADVTDYGRGYDGTAWVKQYEANADGGRYKYVLVAELNTVIPNFHLLVEPPAENANAPYFDRDSTNVDYYLHVTPTLKNEIGIVGQNGLSDEKINQYEDIWNYPTGNQHKEEHAAQLQTNQPGNIYYNAAGFDVAKRTFNTTVQDSINYELTESGRHYSNGAYDPYGKTGVADTRTWHIHLPSIGNAICSVWDKMYGTSRNQTYSSSRGDSKALYDQTTFIGAVNRLRDLLGYTFKAKGSLAVGHAIAVEDNNLYYDGNPPSAYYYYAYSPEFKEDSTGDYYKDGDEFKPVNKQVVTSGYYRLVDRWVLTQLRMPEEDSLYGFIIALHRLVGTGDDDSRDMETIRGCINKIKDIVANIDLQLKPGKLMHTNNSGIIETTETAYPSADVDKTRVLIGQPTGEHSWENRVRKIGVLSPETSESVWTTNTGTIDTNTNNNNVVNFKAGNKWIGFNVDTDNDQLIQVLHTASAQAAHDFATDVVIDDDIDGSKGTDCEFTIPLVKTDNAGHVIGYTTKTIYVPYGYHNIVLAAQSAAETAITTSNGTQSADATNDNFTFATGNQWIEARVDEDKITFAHALIDDQATQKWEFKSTATIGWQAASADGNKLTIPTFEIDNAGHIVRSDSVDFYIPHNFRNITVGANGADTDATQTAGTIEADSTTDTWTIASQNKWLRVAADATNDKITIGHSYSAQSEHDFDTDVEIVSALDGTSQTDNKIVLPVLKTDNAGHIIGYSTNTFYIPHNFKSITVVSDDSDVDSTQTNGTLVADNIVDTWTFAPQNKWIDIAADATNDKITIGHKYSPEQTHRNDTGDTVNQTPTFGATFKVPNYETDKAGHITKSSTHTVMIPQNSYTETANKTAGVMTTMSLDKSTGAFTATRANVGTLALTEYTYDANNVSAVDATDSINGAFSKVEAQIAKENVDRSDAVSDLNDNITAMNERLVASDTDLSNRLTTEASTRASEDTRILREANSYTDTKIAGLVNSAPEALDTLNELAVALGGDENFATTVATNIGANTAAINVEKEKIDAHIAAQDNPHKVTASQVGLGNVTNESKATMFTNPAFTGVPTAPTADAGTNSEQLATTAFVAGEVANAKDDINESLKSINESITKEIDARERADQARHEELTNALAVETQARLDSLEGLLNDLLANYGLTLNAPTFEIAQEEVEAEEKVIMTVSASNECTMIWYKKQLDADPIAVSEAVPVGAFDIIEDGEYYCVITRTHNGHTSEAQSEVYNIVVPKLPEPEPEPEPEPTPDPDPEVPEEPEA